jgi:hypothetical protein
MPRGEAGENSRHAMRGQSVATPMSFYCNTYTSKLRKTKKATSSCNAKSKLTRQVLWHQNHKFLPVASDFPQTAPV